MICASHSEKYKTLSSCSKVLAEGGHTADDEKMYRSDVNLSQRDRNVIMFDRQYALERMREAEKTNEGTTGRKTRKDAVRMFSTVTSFPKSWPDRAVKELAEELYNAHTRALKKAGMDVSYRLGYAIHYDEKSPHMHEYDCPMRIDGRLSCKTILSKKTLTQLHKVEWEVYKAFADRHPELEKMASYTHGSERQHLGTQAYKAEKLREEVATLEEKKQITADQIDALEATKKRVERDADRLKGVVKGKTKKVSKLDEQVTTLVNEINYNEMALAGTQADLARLDDEIQDRKKERERLKDEIDAAQKHDDAIKALADETERTRQAYDAIKDHKDDDLGVIADAFKNAKVVGFGRHKGERQITLPEEVYTRFVTMVQNAPYWERAWEVVGGLQERINHVVESAKMYYSKAQTMLEQARQERNETHRIASGETYKQEQAKLETLSRKKESLSRHVDDLEYKRDELQYTVDDLENRKKSLEKGISDIKDKRYQQAFITRYRDAFDDFVADQRKRERSYDDWER